MTQPGAILSLFPGVGLLDRAFEVEGFSVFRGPDIIWGGDIRKFHPPRGSAWGIIAGPPCQDFSGLRRTDPTGYGLEMLAECRRVILEASPEWWVIENVARVPDVRIEGYTWQRFDINQSWFSAVSRLRHWRFGSRSGVLLDPPRGRSRRGCEPAALANDGRSFREVCRLQGLPDDFELPSCTVEGSIRAVGNGVPIPMGRAVARAIRLAYGLPIVTRLYDVHAAAIAAQAAGERRRCACGCGRVVMGRHQYHGPACRKREERRRRRDSARSMPVTSLRTNL